MVDLAHVIGRAVGSAPDGRGGNLSSWLIKPELLPDAAARAAEAIEREFVLIPRSETEPVSADIEVPPTLVEDAPAWESYIVSTVASATAEAARDGLLLISRPTVRQVEDRPTFPGFMRFKIEAMGWRLPDQDPMEVDR